MQVEDSRSARSHGCPAGHLLLRAAGGVFFAIGVVGMFVPLLPTTCFWILAATLWTRSAPRLAARLYAHPRFGPGLEAWVRHGTISRRAKVCACTGMLAGVALARATLALPAWAWLALGAVLLAAAAWIAVRPERAPVPAAAVRPMGG